MLDRIIVTGMRFYGHHGVLPEETRLGQAFVLDIELHADLRAAGVNDDLKSTINYAAAYQTTKEIVEGPPFQLIEAVAEKVAAALLTYAHVQEVVVRVHKPSAPIPGPFDCATVEVHRRRES